MKRIILTATCALMTCASVFAQGEAEPKLVVRPIGRILTDAGVMHSIDETLDNQLSGSVATPDIRMDVSAAYDKREAKVDVGYARQSLSLKDISLGYNFNKEDSVRMGCFVHQFGSQSGTLSSFKISMEEPLVDQTFLNSRLIGAMYAHAGEKFHATAPVFTENDAMKMTTDKLGNEAWGVVVRLVWRPLAERDEISYIGISGAYESPRYNKDAIISHKSYTLKTPFPTYIANVAAQGAKISDAKALWKFPPEMNFVIDNFGFEAQYLYVGIKYNSAIPNYNAWDAYNSVHYLLNGQGYTYAKAGAGIATPDLGPLEFVAAYNYSVLTSKDANILGGKVNDQSLTSNYYPNKYMIWYVRGSIIHATGNVAFNNNTLSIPEAYLQIKF